MRESSSNLGYTKRMKRNRGGEQKVMKKSLSLLLSIAMAFSIFASVALGAEANLTTEQKYQALVEAGIFTGDGPNQDANLDHNMTRAQFAAVLVRAFGLEEDVAASSIYTDLEGAGWAAGYIGAVTKAGLMNGMSANEFGPSLNVTMEQLATVLVRAFDLQQSTSGVTGNVSDWARGYVGAALQAGLISAKADYTAAALRADLVDSAYVVKEIIDQITQPTVAAKATSAKTIEVAFNKPVNKDQVTFEVTNSVGTAVSATVKEWSEDNTTATLETAINLLAGTYTITVKGAAAQDLTASLAVEDEKVAGIQILSDTAPAIMNENGTVKAVRVSYRVVNQYGQDITRTQSINWSTSFGNNYNDNPSEGVLEINLPDPNYIYRVGSEFTVTGFILGTANLSVNATLKIGEEARVHTVEVEGLYHPSNKTLEIDMDSYSDFALLINVKDQYGNPIKDLEQLKKQLNVFSSNPYLVDVRDKDEQYPGFTNTAGANGNQVGIQLYKNFENNNMNLGGTSTITLTPVYYSNQSVQYNLEVSKAAEVVSITLGQPSGVVAAGDVEALIPVTALDQNGKEVTKVDTMNSNLGASIQATVAKEAPEFIEKDGKLYIKYVPDTNYVGPVMITTILKTNGKMTQLQLNVRDAKVPAAVSAMTSIDTTLAGVNNEIKHNSFTVLDQYGTAMAMDNGAGKFYDKFALKVEVYKPGATTAESVYFFTGKDAVEKQVVDGDDVSYEDHGKFFKVTLAQKGNVTLKVSAVNKADKKDIQPSGKPNYTKASEKDFTLRFVEWADVVSFEVADIAKLYDQNSNSDYEGNAPALTVTGKTSAGTKVNIGKLVDGNFTAITTTPGLKITEDDKVTTNGTSVDTETYYGNDNERKGLIVVTVLKDKDTQTLQKEVTISRATPVVTSVKLDAVKIKVADINGKSLAEGVLSKAEFKDQYGTKQAKFMEDAKVTISEVAKKDGSTLNLANGQVKDTDFVVNGAVAGDTFKITVLVGGHVVTQKVTVE